MTLGYRSDSRSAPSWWACGYYPQCVFRLLLGLAVYPDFARWIALFPITGDEPMGMGVWVYFFCTVNRRLKADIV
jgi:hypothetical protein